VLILTKFLKEPCVIFDEILAVAEELQFLGTREEKLNQRTHTSTRPNYAPSNLC